MRLRFIRRLAIALPLALLSGCVGHWYHYLSPPPGYRYHPPREAKPAFTYMAHGRVHLSGPIDVDHGYATLKLWYPSSGDNGASDNEVHALYYKSQSPGRKSLLIVLPIWGTSKYPPHHIAKGYAHHSGGATNVIWIQGNTPLFPWSSLSDAPTEQAFVAVAKNSVERYRSAVIDIRRLLDWATQQPDIYPAQIGIVGFSMSALVTATVMGNDARLKAAVLMMAGAHYADIFSYCGDRAGEVRHHALSTFGWSRQQYHDFFGRLFSPADPATYKGHYDPRKILMIDGAFDDCMPHSSREALWNILGHPTRITLLSQHRSGFYTLTPLGFNFMRRRIYRFLDVAL